MENSTTLISLDGPLRYNHYGQVNGLNDGFGGFIEERAEVMLLSKNNCHYGDRGA